MIKKLLYVSCIMVTTFSLTTCATTKLTHSGGKARVLGSGEVVNCQKRGATTVSTRTVMLTIPRQQTVIAKELQILARNSAVNMGGDTVSAITKIENGQQTFAIYRCVP